MRDHLDAILDTIAGMPPEAVIGGLLLALVLASPMAWAHAACRRKAAGGDAGGERDARAMLPVVLAMVANLIGMAVASGYSASSVGLARAAAIRSPPRCGPGRPHRPGSPECLAKCVTPDLFEAGDANHDGLLSADEATAAAGWIRVAALQGRLTPPHPGAGAGGEPIEKGRTAPR